MKFFRMNYGAPISVVMSAAMLFNLLAVLPISAKWVSREVEIPGHNITIRIFIPGIGGTNGTPGYYST